MTITGEALLDRHAKALTQGFGSSAVVIGSTRTRGLLSDEELYGVDEGGNPVRLRQRRLTLWTGAVDTLPARDSTLTIDGTTYTVRNVERRDDARTVEIEVVP